MSGGWQLQKNTDLNLHFEWTKQNKSVQIDISLIHRLTSNKQVMSNFIAIILKIEEG